MRIKDASGDRRILLDGIEEIAEYDTVTGERIRRYDHDPSRVDGLLAQKGSGGQKLNAYSDALGSVYGLVDAQGTAQAKYGYDVYGARTASLENVGTDWGFTGRRFDGATGLGYYRARYYGAEVGAFTQRDPWWTRWSLDVGRRWYDIPLVYGYVAAQPVMATDPMGLRPRFMNCKGGRAEAAYDDLLVYMFVAAYDDIQPCTCLKNWQTGFPWSLFERKFYLLSLIRYLVEELEVVTCSDGPIKAYERDGYGGLTETLACGDAPHSVPPLPPQDFRIVIADFADPSTYRSGACGGPKTCLKGIIAHESAHQALNLIDGQDNNMLFPIQSCPCRGEF